MVVFLFEYYFISSGIVFAKESVKIMSAIHEENRMQIEKLAEELSGESKGIDICKKE